MVSGFVIFIPILAALVYLCISRKYEGEAAVIGSIASLIIFLLFKEELYPSSIFSGFLPLNIVLDFSFMHSILAFLVLFIGTLTSFFSLGFIEEKSQKKRYFVELLLFEASMLLFSISGTLIGIFIGWELMSVTSFLLIGFYRNKRSNAASRLSFNFVLIGDFALLAAIAISIAKFSTTSISYINTITGSYSTIIAILIILAVITKSAQFPFYEWLAEAMEGPTPVSAYLHSSTMVKAGVFLAIILYPLLYNSHVISLLLIFSVITAVIATYNAIREFHIKRVLAYSTIQELSLISIATSLGAISAAFYLFLAQAFYKSLNFFSSGNVMKAIGEEDLRKVRSIRSSRQLFAYALIGVFSMAGIFPFDGFLSNYYYSFIPGLLVNLFLLTISLFTAALAFRWFYFPNRGPYDPRYRILPKSTIYSMPLLALMCLLASFAPFYLPPLSQLPKIGLNKNLATSLIVPFLGAVFGIYLAKRSKEDIEESSFITRISMGAYSLLAKAVYELSAAFGMFDYALSDALDNVAILTSKLGEYVRRVTFGQINAYLILFSIAFILLFILYYVK
ncbi:MAG: proton-conducting transporter membrane subunit [Candidatus Micrarchaeaceae archaeon]